MNYQYPEVQDTTSIKKSKLPFIITIISFMLIGIIVLSSIRAATVDVSVEVAEDGVSGGAVVKNDDELAAGTYVEFGPTVVVDPPPAPEGYPYDNQPKAGHTDLVGCLVEADCEVITGTLVPESGDVVMNKIVTNPEGECLRIEGKENITIKNVTFKDCGSKPGAKLVRLADDPDPNHGDYGFLVIDNSKNITLDSIIMKNISNAQAGWVEGTLNSSCTAKVTKAEGLWLRDTDGVTIVNSHIEDINMHEVSSVQNLICDQGNRAIKVRTSKNLTIAHNVFINPGRDAVQYTRMGNQPGLKFSHNIIRGKDVKSPFEDIVSFYASSGTADSPVEVIGNYIRGGGYTTDSGAGINMGDGDCKSTARTCATVYIKVNDNVLYNAMGAGLAVGSAEVAEIKNNKIYSERTPSSGGYILDFYNTCKTVVAEGNRVNVKGTPMDVQSNDTRKKPCSNITGQTTNASFADASLGAAIWDVPY